MSTHSVKDIRNMSTLRIEPIPMQHVTSLSHRRRGLVPFSVVRSPGSLIALLISSSTGFVYQSNRMNTLQCSDSSNMWKARVQQSKRLCSSNLDSLQEGMKQAYYQRETDGILEFAANLECGSLDVKEIIAASLVTSEGRSGDTASILNALIGSCCLQEDDELAADLAARLLDGFEELEHSHGIKTDTVTYSLAYTALSRDARSAKTTDYVLDQAVRKSRKIAGGKRRKTLAAARRKGQPVFAGEMEDKMRSLCGEDFAVLEENDEFLVVNKPSGIPCFHKKTTTAGKVRKRKGKDQASAEDASLVDALVACNVPLSTLNPEALGLVHRLDRGSSGCLVLAKTDEVHAKLITEFFLRRAKKRYLTVVSPAPDPSIPAVGSIDLPVHGRPALSRYQIKEKFGGTGALLEFDIYTGRKHQIRIHVSEGLSTSVYMDTMYNDIIGAQAGTLPGNSTKERFLLHAFSLDIPELGVHAKANLPGWWETSIASLKEQ